MERIAILGGTFNPVHLEHVELCKHAIAELNLDKLIVMPTYISPHKTRVPAPALDRIEMLKKAFVGVEKVQINDYEILKEGKSYTYQTVEHFCQNKNVRLFFIMGGDMLTDFKSWRYPERIVKNCTLAVFEREKTFTDFEKERKYFKQVFDTDFIKLNYVGKDYSSTKIRTYAKFGLPIDNMVGSSVAEYIKEQKLYQPDLYEQFVIKNLPIKRLKHTAEVVITALKRARELSLNEEKVRIACTLHDCAKHIDYNTEKDFSLEKDVPQPVIHAFLGAHIAKKYLGIDDKEILDAISYHTSGRENMPLLEKLVFVADMVEDGRTYEGVENLRNLYVNADFETCFIECLKEEFLHLINKKQYIYAKTIEAFNYYVK